MKLIKHFLPAALLAIFGILSGCKVAAAAAAAPFHVDTYEAIVLEYASPTKIVGVSAYGPTDKEETCLHAAAASVTQGNQMPGGHQYAATCLRIKLDTPALTGQVVMQPFNGPVAAYIDIAVAIDGVGNLIGVQALHGFSAATACQAHAESVRKDVVGTHVFPAGTSFLVYCLGTPVLAPPASNVRWSGRCPWNPFSVSSCELATVLRVSLGE